MITREEAKAKILKKMERVERYDDYGVEVFFRDDQKKGLCCEIRVSKMYEFYDEQAFQFDDLKFFSELLGTDAINVGAVDYRSGCETCDYGSRSEVSVYCEKVTAVT